MNIFMCHHTSYVGYCWRYPRIRFVELFSALWLHGVKAKGEWLKWENERAEKRKKRKAWLTRIDPLCIVIYVVGISQFAHGRWLYIAARLHKKGNFLHDNTTYIGIFEINIFLPRIYICTKVKFSLETWTCSSLRDIWMICVLDHQI